MISNILTKVFGSRNERLLKQYGQVVREINALEPAISALTDDEVRGRTEFGDRLRGQLAAFGVAADDHDRCPVVGNECVEDADRGDGRDQERSCHSGLLSLSKMLSSALSAGG